MKKTIFVPVVMAIMLAGCDQYLPILDEGTPGEDVMADAVVADTDDNDVSGRDLSGETDEECRLQILMQMPSEPPTEVTVGNHLEISAVVVDYMKAAPAKDALVNFSITSIEDFDGNQVTGDGNLETSAQYSDLQGRVANDFFAGMDAERIYTITLSLPECPQVEPVSVRIKILAFECGSLRVDFAYNGVIEFPLRDIEVFVVPATYQCGKHIVPGSTVPEDKIIASRTAPGVTSTVTFDCLPAGTYYTVFARAGAGDLTCTAAGACSRTLVIMPNQTDEMTLEFSEVTFQAAGRYNAVDHFNFEPLIEMCAGGETSIIDCVTSGSEDVGKTVCCAIQEMVKLFNTPGSTVVDLLFDALKLWISPAIIEAVEAIIGGPLKDFLNTLIAGWAQDTPWLAAFLTAGDDLTQIISHLELESELLLEKQGNDFTVQGTHYWHAINLYWRMNCPAEGEPNYDPECGKYSLDMLDIQQVPEDFPMELLEGVFIADVMNFNWLSLRQHEIALSYGKLVLWAINDIFIPEISGDQAHSIEELARLWLDCKGLAAGDLGDYWEQAGGDRSDVENTCNSIVTTLINPLDDIVGRLSLSTTLTLTGNGRMIDDNCDAIIDRIVDGTYIGFVESNSQQASITGDWSAERILQQAD